MLFLDPKTLKRVIDAVRKEFSLSIEYAIIKHKGLAREVGPRGGRRFICNKCSNIFDENSIKIDHIIPIVPLDSSAAEMGLEMFYNRCRCSADNLQVLCKTCHDLKSKQENEERKKFRKLRKLNLLRK